MNGSPTFTRSPRHAAPLRQDEALHLLARRYADPQQVLQHEPPLAVEVDRERARYSTWYEMFPRSASARPGTHGTFADCEARLPYVAEMGFDVLYLPPIHPIGTLVRKGPNNRPSADAERPRQPLGHRQRSRRPQGDQSRARHARGLPPPARRGGGLGIEIALDIAFQCRPIIRTCASIRNGSASGPDGTHQVRREPAQEVPGHLSLRLRDALTGAELWKELPSVIDFWVGAGRAHLPRRQSAHQAVRLLGMVHRARARARIRR